MFYIQQHLCMYRSAEGWTMFTCINCGTVYMGHKHSDPMIRVKRYVHAIRGHTGRWTHMRTVQDSSLRD